MSEHRNRLDDLLNVQVPAPPGVPADAQAPAADSGAPPGVPGAPAGQESSPPQPSVPPLPPPPPIGRLGKPPAPPPAQPPAPPAHLPAAARVGQVADGLRRATAGLEASAAAALSREYQGRSDDGLVTVTVDGRPRVTGVRMGVQALRAVPERLAAQVTAAVNAGMNAARDAGREALLAAAEPSMQPWLRGAFEAAAGLGGKGESPPPSTPVGAGGSSGDAAVSMAELRQLRQSVPERQAAARGRATLQVLTGRSRDGRVTATVNGLGEVTGIAFSALAARGTDAATLGLGIMEAVNAALGKAAQHWQAQRAASGGRRAPGDPRSAGDAALEMLRYRMDGLLADLDRVGRRLEEVSDDLSDGLARMVRQLQDLADEVPEDASGPPGADTGHAP